MAGATRKKPAKAKKADIGKMPVDGGDSSSEKPVKKPANKPKKKTTKVVRRLVKKVTAGKLAKKAARKTAKKSAVKAVRRLVKKVAAVVVTEPSKNAKNAPAPAPQRAARAEESWFWVSALYRLMPIGAATLPPERGDQWERRVFVIRAARGEERRAAQRVAKLHETRHGVPKGERAMWRLQEIEAFAQLFDEHIESGTEVYWQFFTRT